jgi:hypothetical protein
MATSTPGLSIVRMRKLLQKDEELKFTFNNLKKNGVYKTDSDILRYLYVMHVRNNVLLYTKYMQL